MMRYARWPPVHRFPGPLDPAHAVLVPAAVYLAWQALSAAVLLVAAWPNVDQALGVWGLAGLGFGLPFGVLLGALGRRLERRLYGVNPGFGWYAVGLGLAFAAHWAAVATWPVILWVATFAQPWRAGRFTEASIVAMGAWVAVGVGLLLASRGLKALRPEAREGFPPPRWLPPSILLGVAYLCATATPAVIGVGWLSGGGWSAGSGTAAVLGWLFAGGAMGALAGGLTALWRAAQHQAEGRALEARPADQMEVAGAVVAAHWLGVFGLALTPIVDVADLRWTLLGLSFVFVLVGTAVWSAGRTWREGESELAVDDRREAAPAA